jgi:hypothetical protein
VTRTWPAPGRGTADRDRFCRTLVHRSGGIWIYALSVIDQIRQGGRAPTDVDTLPEGLAAYYANNIQRWRADPCIDWDRELAPLLGTLAAAREARTTTSLADWAGIPEPTARALIQGPLRAFLVPDAVATARACTPCGTRACASSATTTYRRTPTNNSTTPPKTSPPTPTRHIDGSPTRSPHRAPTAFATGRQRLIPSTPGSMWPTTPPKATVWLIWSLIQISCSLFRCRNCNGSAQGREPARRPSPPWKWPPTRGYPNTTQQSDKMLHNRQKSALPNRPTHSLR